MNVIEQVDLLSLLQGRRETSATRWYDALRGMGFVSLSAAEVQGVFSALVDRVIVLLLTEPLARAGARDIGAALARLHYIQPEVYTAT